MRSDLIETFKIVKTENMILIPSYFFSWMRVIEGDMTRNCSRKDLDQMLGNMRFRIELLIIGICCLPVVLIAVLLTPKTHLSSELESEAVKFKVCQL